MSAADDKGYSVNIGVFRAGLLLFIPFWAAVALIVWRIA